MSKESHSPSSDLDAKIGSQESSKFQIITKTSMIYLNIDIIFIKKT